MIEFWLSSDFCAFLPTPSIRLSRTPPCARLIPRRVERLSGIYLNKYVLYCSLPRTAPPQSVSFLTPDALTALYSSASRSESIAHSKPKPRSPQKFEVVRVTAQILSRIPTSPTYSLQGTRSPFAQRDPHASFGLSGASSASAVFQKDQMV